MADPSTIDNVTDLSAVNSILGAIGQAPINKLDFTNPEISYIFSILRDVNRDVQGEGWCFNTEEHYELNPDGDQHIQVTSKMLRLDIHEDGILRNTNVVKRGGKLWDKANHTYKFSNKIYADVTWLFEFDELPSVFQRYITSRAAAKAAAQLVTSPQLTSLLQIEEQTNRASCIEYECNQGDHSFLGWSDHANYRSYQPAQGLRRHA